jgi:hypothetical protein
MAKSAIFGPIAKRAIFGLVAKSAIFDAGIPHLWFFLLLFRKNAQNAQNAAEMLSGRHRVAFFIAKISPWPVHNNFFRFLPFAGLP